MPIQPLLRILFPWDVLFSELILGHNCPCGHSIKGIWKWHEYLGGNLVMKHYNGEMTVVGDE